MDEPTADSVAGTTINSTPGASTCNIEQMRKWLFWVGIIFGFVWMILILGLSAYVFIITKSFFSLFVSAASAPAVELIRRFANYLLPMDEKRYLLAVKKIETRALKYSNRKQCNENNAKKR